MMKHVALGALIACALCSNLFAQTTAASVQSAPTSTSSAPVPIQAVAPGTLQPQTVLPTNTEVAMTMNEDLTTKGGRIETGHMFRLTVSQDVRVANYVVIPRGTPAFGEVTWLTGKGAFGKSGKMEIDLRYIDLNGRRIPISGHYRQEGEGNTVATVAGVIAVGVFAAFITGKSARIPQGRELKAFTSEALPVALPAAVPQQSPLPVQATPAATVAPGVSIARPGTKLW